MGSFQPSICFWPSTILAPLALGACRGAGFATASGHHSLMIINQQRLLNGKLCRCFKLLLQLCYFNSFRVIVDSFQVSIRFLYPPVNDYKGYRNRTKMAKNKLTQCSPLSQCFPVFRSIFLSTMKNTEMNRKIAT